MIVRQAGGRLSTMLDKFPGVVLIGPRQVGPWLKQSPITLALKPFIWTWNYLPTGSN
jgi:hypothetical protein